MKCKCVHKCFGLIMYFTMLWYRCDFALRMLVTGVAEDHCTAQQTGSWMRFADWLRVAQSGRGQALNSEQRF